MQIVINIDENVYKRVFPYKDAYLVRSSANDLSELIYAVANGTPLPKGHGRLIYAKDAVKELFDRAPTIIEADRSEEE